MLPPRHSINSNVFLLKNDAAYLVTILLGKNILQIAVTDEEKKSVETLQEYFTSDKNLTKAQVQEILNTELIRSAKSVTIGLDSTKSVLVPDELYDSKSKASYIKPLFELEKREVYAQHEIIAVEATSVFSIKDTTFRLLQSVLPKASFKHSKTALIKAYSQQIMGNRTFSAFINSGEEKCWLTIFKGAKLLLHNEYEVESDLDVFYYAFNAIKQFGISRNQIGFQLSGEEESYESLIKLFKDQKIDARMINRIPSLGYADQIYRQPSHRFYNLFALVLCA